MSTCLLPFQLGDAVFGKPVGHDSYLSVRFTGGRSHHFVCRDDDLSLLCLNKDGGSTYPGDLGPKVSNDRTGEPKASGVFPPFDGRLMPWIYGTQSDAMLALTSRYLLTVIHSLICGWED
jgi:hypothetical protein